MWKNKANWKQYKERLKKKTDIKMPGGYNEITRNDSNWFHHTISMTRIRFFDKKGCRKNKPGKYPFKELK